MCLYRTKAILWRIKWEFPQANTHYVEAKYVFVFGLWKCQGVHFVTGKLKGGFQIECYFCGVIVINSRTLLYFLFTSLFSVHYRVSENKSIKSLLEKYLHPTLADPVFKQKYILTYIQGV
jgi:hypothetical protein